jgi:AcrR family transcriptional regulator
VSQDFPDGDELEEGADGEEPAEAQVQAALASQIGESIAEAVARLRRVQELHHIETHPDEGLRERKKRQTRQRISDVATALFVFRGFDAVRVADVADVVGVSEKTIYNYFPTKEAMVFDNEDEEVGRIATALRERTDDESLTRAVLRATIAEVEQFAASEGLETFLPALADMIAATPSLRAALLDIQARLIEVTAEELATGVDVDPQDPEPMIAARAIVGLRDVSFDMLVRHTRAGLRGQSLRDAVVDDLERAARLLETGLWSFKLLAKGARTRQQLLEATRAADEARSEVVKAMKEARAAWRSLAREQGEELRRSTRDASRTLRKDAERSAAKIGRDAWKTAREAQKSWRQAHVIAEQAAYESFRESLRDGPADKHTD